MFLVTIGLLWFLIIGALINNLFFRNEKLTFTEGISFSFCFGVSIVMILSLILSILKYFSKIYFLLVLFLSFAVLVYFNLNNFKKMKFSYFRPNKKVLVLTLVVLTILIPHTYFTLSKSGYPAMSSFRYYADSQSILQNDGIPKYSFQWFTNMETSTQRIGFTLFSASLMQFSDDDPIPYMKCFSILTLFFVIVSFWTLLRSYFSYSLSIFGLFLIFMNIYFCSIGLFKFNSYNGEALGWVILPIAILSYIRGIKRENNRYILASLLFLTILLLIHGVPGIISLIFLGSFVFGRFLIIKFNVKKIFFYAFLLVLPFLFYFSILYFLSNQTLIFNNATLGGETFYPYNGYDPTQEFQIMIGSEDNHRYISDTLFYFSPLELSAEFSNRIFNVLIFFNIINQSYLSKSSPLIFIVISLLFLFACKKVPIKDKEILISAFLLYIFIFLWAIIFSAMYKTYFPAAQIFRRESYYIGFSIVILIMISLKNLANYKKFSKFTKTNFFKIISMIFVVFLFITPSILYLEKKYNPILTDDGIKALGYIKENSRDDIVILSNERTVATIEVFSGKKGVIEGGTIYHKYDCLIRSLKMMEEVKGYYKSPENKMIIDKYGIDFVVIAPGNSLGGNNVALDGINLQKFLSVDYLKFEINFGKIYIFRVK